MPVIDRSNRHKMSKDLVEQHKSVHWVSTPADYTFFFNFTWNIHKDHILWHKTYLKYKRIEILQNRLS